MIDKDIADMYKILSHAYYYYRREIIEYHGEIRDKFEWLPSSSGLYPKNVKKEFIAGIKAAALLIEEKMNDKSLIDDVRVDNIPESRVKEFLSIRKDDL